MGNQILKSTVFALSPSSAPEDDSLSTYSPPTPGVLTPPLPPEKKPCRTCTDFKSWAKFQASKRLTAAAEGKEVVLEKSIEEELQERAHLQCPLDRDELGRATWSFLHTVAANYPDQPSPQEEKEMSAFLKIFSKYYPCEECAKDFQKSIRRDPPKTGSSQALSLWLCEMHNEVNRKLGKEEFDCGKVNERWKDGWADGTCD